MPACLIALRGRGIERDLYAIALRPDERDAVLAVLEDPPASLAELRGTLLRNHSDRAT